MFNPSAAAIGHTLLKFYLAFILALVVDAILRDKTVLLRFDEDLLEAAFLEDG